MDNSISPEMEERMRALCDDIASAEDLNSDLHDELYTHIEEKVLGYLSGEEMLSEADAYLLAKEHFGDRAKVRTQLEEVHPAGVKFKLYRRLSIAMILTIALGFCMGVPMQLFAVVLEQLSASLFAKAWVNFVFMIILFVLTMVIIFKVLNTWKQKELRGEPIWFQRWSTGRLFLLLGAMIVFIQLIGIVQRIVFFSIYKPNSDIVYYAIPNSLTVLLMFVGTAGIVAAWLMWFDIHPRPKGTLFRVVFVCVIQWIYRNASELNLVQANDSSGRAKLLFSHR